MREDLAHHGRVLHGCDEAQPAATAWAGEDIEIERAAHEDGPSCMRRTALQAPAILTVGVASSSSPTVVTLWGIVISAPRMLISVKTDFRKTG